MSIFQKIFGNSLNPQKEPARIEGVVHLFVMQVIQVMPGFVEKNLALLETYKLLPIATDTKQRISTELAIASVAHSIALTPNPLILRERQRYVTAHREAAQCVFQEHGVPDVDSILRQYCEAHDRVVKSWNHPLKRMFTNQGFKIPMQHILEVFPIVAYDRLGCRHEDGVDPAYPHMKNPVVIEAWHKGLCIVTSKFWEMGFQRYDVA